MSDEERGLIVEALEHIYAYTRAAQREDARYQELADALKVNVEDAPQHEASTKKKR